MTSTRRREYSNDCSSTHALLPNPMNDHVALRGCRKHMRLSDFSPDLWTSSIVSQTDCSVSRPTAFTAQAVVYMQVVNMVADRMPQILKMGVPIPDHIPFYMDKTIPEDHDRQINNGTQLSKHAAPQPQTHALMILNLGVPCMCLAMPSDPAYSTSEVKPTLTALSPSLAYMLG